MYINWNCSVNAQSMNIWTFEVISWTFNVHSEIASKKIASKLPVSKCRNVASAKSSVCAHTLWTHSQTLTEAMVTSDCVFYTSAHCARVRYFSTIPAKVENWERHYTGALFHLNENLLLVDFIRWCGYMLGYVYLWRSEVIWPFHA